MAELTIPGGKSKGTPLSEAADSDLKYWRDRIATDLAKEPDGRFATRNRGLLAGFDNEIQERASRPAPVAQQAQAIERAQQSAPVAAERAQPQGGLSIDTLHDPAELTRQLRSHAERFHLVTPATSVGVLPPGCSVSISYVTVDTSTERGGPGEVYAVGDKLGLSGSTLKKIAAAAGLDWDPQQCGRLDDGRDPHYCHYRAVGYVRAFDGSMRTVTGEVEIDAREGSPLIGEIREKAAARSQKYGKPNDGGASQILELRKFLLRHAESKAKNRAIADMGVKRSYTKSELEKPFAVARLQWTGETSDPELKREFAMMHAERMLDGTSALYGRRSAMPAQPQPSPRALQGHAPPPVGAVNDDPDDYLTHDLAAQGEAAPRQESLAEGEMY